MKRLCKLLTGNLVLLLLLFGHLSVAQNTLRVTGRVVDAQTGKPLNAVSVFLNGTKIGTSTNQEGNFGLSYTKTNIPLMVSCVGYESQKIDNYTEKQLEITLNPKVRQLADVTIGWLSRKTEIEIFLREFIGPDQANCVITNLDDIWFKYDHRKDSLTAGADKPLFIYNKTLGYKITYFLSNFVHTPVTTSFSGSYFFAEDTSDIKNNKVRKIIAARKEAYLISRMHFIRSLWANELRKNSYVISAPVSKYVDDPDDLKSIKKGIRYENLVHVRNDNIFHDQKYMLLKSELLITYGGDISSVRPEKNSAGSLIDSNGYYGSGLIWNGELGKERICRLLPFDYSPN